MAEALRLADELDDIHTTHVARNAAAELRRLSAENKLLHERHHDDNVEYTRVLAQRDALLRALKLIQHATAPTHNDGAYHEAAHDICSAAIQSVEGEK